MKVLIAEDEVQMNRVLTTALTHEGYEVDSVFDYEAYIIEKWLYAKLYFQSFY